MYDLVTGFWSTVEILMSCLIGAASGHRLLPRDGRVIRVSDFWIISEENSCTRTLSRWYRLGRPYEAVHEDQTSVS
jgi:hypothetical protein